MEALHEAVSDALTTTITREEVEAEIKQLTRKYEEGDYSFHIQRVGGGYCFVIKEACQKDVKVLLEAQGKYRLSVACLETLSVIAYEQPVTKNTIERIRGVSSEGIIHKLLQKDLICVKGHAEVMGRPLLYETSPQFVNYFGINDLKDLPSIRAIQKDLSIADEDEKAS